MKIAIMIVLAPIVLTLGTGCIGDAPDSSATHSVTDSAGVRVVHVDDEFFADHEVGLAGAGILRLGRPSGDGPDVFGRINSIHLGPDRTVWVADVSTSEVKVFSIDSGEHRFTIGGRGQGPGEFRMPEPRGFDSSDRAWIWDQGLGRLTIVTLDGELGDVRPLRVPDDIVPRVLQRFSDGGLAIRVPRFVPPPAEGAVFQDTVEVWEAELPDSGTVTSPTRRLALSTGQTWYYRNGRQLPVPFSPGSILGLGHDRVVLTNPDGSASLSVVEDGQPTTRIVLDRTLAPVTNAAVDGVISEHDSISAAILRAGIRELPVPDLIPAWRWIRLSPGGWIYALRYGTLLKGEVWDVFRGDGTPVGAVRLPSGWHIMDAGTDLLAVLQIDESGYHGLSVFEVPFSP